MKQVLVERDNSSNDVIEENVYVCSICGSVGVKLWRPYGGTDILICALCAEERQSPYEYDDLNWQKDIKENCYIRIKTGRKLKLDKWKVDKKGLVPSYRGPGPKKLKQEKTDQLIVDIGDVSELYTSGNTIMIPAVTDDNSNFYCYGALPEALCVWWRNLPTRIN